MPIDTCMWIGEDCNPMAILINLAIAMTLSLAAPATAIQGTSISEERLLLWLNSPRQDIKQAAVAHILQAVPPENRSAAVDQALANELARVNQLLATRREADRSGLPMDDAFPSEYHAELIEAVSQSRRTLVISPLAESLGTGTLVEEGLAKFGEQAISTVAAIARKRVGTISGGAPNDTPPHVVAGALRVLHIIVERTPNLPEASRRELVALARARLNGQQDAAVIVATCGLAVATHDPSLRVRVEQLATDGGPAQLGVKDPLAARLVRDAAGRALQQPRR